MLLDYAHYRELPLLYQFPLSEQPIKHFMCFDDLDAHQANFHYPLSKTQARHLRTLSTKQGAPRTRITYHSPTVLYSGRVRRVR